jgi:transporter family-2 protein
MYAVLALATGVLLAFTTTVNAALGKRIGVFPSTLVNYITGLATTLICVLVLGRWAMPGPGLMPFLLCGGALGVVIIVITSLSLPKVPVVYVTVILFIGQVAMGMVIDAFNGTAMTVSRGLGFCLIVAGLFWNMSVDRRAQG